MKKTKKQLTETHFAFILDESSSMHALRDEMISVFNEQINTIRNDHSDSGLVTVSFSTFDYNHKELYFMSSVDSIEDLTTDTYIPSGVTAMYDCVGSVVSKLVKFDDKDKNIAFVVIILSDGYENASHTYNSKSIAELIAPLAETNRWEFVYIGANQDLSIATKAMGIKPNCSTSYEPTTSGLEKLSVNMSVATSNVLRSRSIGNETSYTISLNN